MATNPRRTAETRSVLTPRTNMRLPTEATSHSPASPTISSEIAIIRSPQIYRSRSSLEDVVDANKRRVDQILENFSKTFEGTSSPHKTLRDSSLPIPHGLLHKTVDSSIMRVPEFERRASRRGRRPARYHDSDSGLGTSVTSHNEKVVIAKEISAKTCAVTKSAAARATAGSHLSSLGLRATQRIYEHTLKPLLAKPNFRDFYSLVHECPRKMQENEVVCLRDVEKTLLLLAPGRTKSVDVYLDFCLTTVRCIQATVEHLSDREQARPRDVPYSSGYFVDLVDQIRQYADQIADAKDKKDMELDPTDEIKLYGGIHVNGRPAELVRVKKNGEAISLATGKRVEMVDEEGEADIRVKRSTSQEREEEEDIIRSMARRKKNANLEEIAPNKCREPGCHKEFKRPCDLTKHEKTHSRPWKCRVPTCKYHEYGWPTEKEMDRHYNDKHDSDPQMHKCHFTPCPYRSKRESNCKQHMEKAHGFVYVRTKTNGKKQSDLPSLSGSFSAEPTPLLQNIPTPSSEHSMGVATPPDDWDRQYDLQFSGLNYSEADFNIIPQEITLDYSPLDHPTPSSTNSSIDHNSAFHDLGGNFNMHDDIYGAHAQLPIHGLPSESLSTYGLPIQRLSPHGLPGMQQKVMPQQFTYKTADLCQPLPAQIPSIPSADQPSALLFTPTSLDGVDDGLEERRDYLKMSNAKHDDFILFPHAATSKAMFQERPLFSHQGISPMVPSFIQSTSQELMNNLSLNWQTQSMPGFPQ